MVFLVYLMFVRCHFQYFSDGGAFMCADDLGAPFELDEQRRVDGGREIIFVGDAHG